MTTWFKTYINKHLEKTDEVIKNGQSRETGNIGYTQDAGRR